MESLVASPTLKSHELVIRKLNLDNAISLAKGSIKNTIPVNVNAKIVNQLTNSRVDTTQGVDIIKKLIAIELTDALNTIFQEYSCIRGDEYSRSILVETTGSSYIAY